MKLVINNCFGGFNLSKKAVARLVELGCPVALAYVAQCESNRIEVANNPDERQRQLYQRMQESDLFSNMNHVRYERNEPLLIQVVEELGEEAGGRCAKLKIIEIPDGVEYEVDEYDGLETVREKHRSWS